MKNKLKTCLKDRVGGISIVFAIFGLIMVIVVGGGRNILFKKVSLAEVRNAMDIAGVSALRNSINNEEQRIENQNAADVFDKNKAESIYRTLLTETLSKQNYIVSYEFTEIEAGVDDSNWRFDDNQSRKQAWINCTLSVRYNSGFFDNSELVSRTFYDSKRDNVYSLQFTGVRDDGLSEILVHSTSRIVYR